MKPEDIFEIVSFSLKERADAWEIYFSRGRGLKIETKEGKIENFQPQESEGLSIRVITGQRLGFAYTSQINPEIVRKTAAKALENAQVTERDEAHQLPSGESLPQAPEIRDQTIDSLSIEEKIEIALSIHQAATKTDPRIKKVQQAKYQDGLQEVAIFNSLGVSGKAISTNFSLSCVAVAEEKDTSEMGWEYQASRFLSDLNPSRVGQVAAQRALERLGAIKPESSYLPTIFRPYITVDFLELLSISFCGDNIVKGKSQLAGKKGETLFAKQVNIVDDGLLPKGLATRAFDDEGVGQQTTLLVVEGRVEGFLFDTYWAQRAGERSTGNAARGGFQSPPLVSTTNLYLQPGNISPDELIKTLPKGVIITEVLGMHTADPVSGDFSVGAAGLLVKDGEIVSSLTGLAISGNIFDIFKRIEVVCSDLCFYGSIGAPSILIGGLDISGR